MKIYSWNVNGYRAVIQKNFREWFEGCGGDIICLQETKANPDQIDDKDKDFGAEWKAVWNSSRKKKGYSGTACFYKQEPLSVRYGLPDDEFNGEGRMIALEYEQFHLVNCYFPNGQMNDERLEFKLGYYDSFFRYAQELRQSKPVVLCGDLNTAHKEIDLKNPKANENTSGFLPVERAWMDTFVAAGYMDTFRMFNEEGGNYSWWTYRFGARKRNAGWRIDYFFVSEELRDNVKSAWIEADVMGSDHCPVGLELEF